MPDRNQILETVVTASVEDLTDAILKGIVTIDELMETGVLAAPKRKKIIERQLALEAEDDSAWSKACVTESEFALRQYLFIYPSGRHTNEALQKIENITIVNNRREEERRRILEGLKNNPNSLQRSEVANYLHIGVVTQDDLENCEIPNSVINAIHSTQTIFELRDFSPAPDNIPGGFTEVYFWGVPGSGKTTTLAAILSAAQSEGQLELGTGNSVRYMGKLKNVFSRRDSILPGPTPVDDTQFLPLVLRSPNSTLQNKSICNLGKFLGFDEPPKRSISLIELSGEIFEDFFHHNTGSELSGAHKKAFNTLQRYLSSSNKKIHFFLIDAGGNYLDNETGLQTSDYLSAAATYFGQSGIFKKNTDAIYIIVTKSDMLHETGANVSYKDAVEASKNYLNGNNFKSFVTTLKSYCKEFGINGGKLEVEPFSLGSLYFKDICHFDNSSALRIIDILHKRVRASSKSIFDELNK
jgi:hypothetical protein